MMKMLLALGLTILVNPAYAGLLDISGLATLAAEKSREARACSLLDLDGKVAGGAYLPIWTIHGLQGTDAAVLPEQYLSIGIGGAIRQGESFRPVIPLTANLPALSSSLWSSRWAQSYLTRTKFPPIWIGPHVRLPLPGDSFRWDAWREWVGVIVSIGLGG